MYLSVVAGTHASTVPVLRNAPWWTPLMTIGAPGRGDEDRLVDAAHPATVQAMPAPRAHQFTAPNPRAGWYE